MKNLTDGRGTAAPFSRHRSQHSNAQALDPFSGPNVARLEADPFTCFADGEGDDDGGAEATFTQDDLDRVVKGRLAEERRKFQKQLETVQSTPSEELETLRAELEQMKEAAEMAGKSAAEKAEMQREKERAAYERKLQESQSAIAERDKQLEAQVATLRGERLNRALTAALSSAKLMPETLPDAALLAQAQLQDVTHHDDGSITASFGDAIDAPIGEAIAEWVKTKPHLMPGPSGGAGTQNNGSGGGGKPLHKMTDAELLRASRRS